MDSKAEMTRRGPRTQTHDQRRAGAHTEEEQRDDDHADTSEQRERASNTTEPNPPYLGAQ
jgi:hypothetical protein